VTNPMRTAVADLPGLCRLERRPLVSDHTPAQALRTVRDDRHPVALSGAWFRGGSLVASEPVETSAGPAGVDPFTLLDATTTIGGNDDDGVYGGWIGNLGYRCGSLVERLPGGPPRPVATADWWLGYYDHVLHRDAAGNWWFEALWTEDRADELEARYAILADRLAAEPEAPRPVSCDAFTTVPGDVDHRRAVRRAIDRIEAGDIYQANVCQRLDATLHGDPLDLFTRGLDALAPPYAAYLGHGAGGAVVSLSPELFLRRAGSDVSTCPIKGTRRREDDPGADAAARDELARSSKDRAENVMIVDLMRNDLGRVCIPGSIAVTRLFDVEAHPGVWHLVSEIVGVLRAGVGDGALLRASFPPGSVTGAPKVRAMEVIAEVEATGREAYTGSIGMVSPVAGAEWNVAIRTFESVGDRIWMGVGGGIVADSDPEAELEECRTKARPLLEAIGAELIVSPS
jgi:para-aminobenzoate synthetase / 4-amino-4-deoxychorismate lyase